METETIEEVKDRKYPLTNIMHLQLNTAIRTGFDDGAKWQAERMYNEEDMIEFYLFCITELLSSKSSAKSTKELFEQFKKKVMELIKRLSIACLGFLFMY